MNGVCSWIRLRLDPRYIVSLQVILEDPQILIHVAGKFLSAKRSSIAIRKAWVHKNMSFYRNLIRDWVRA